MTIYAMVSWVLALVGFIGSIVFMNNVKSRVPEGQQDQSSLTSQERLYVIVYCMLAPIFAQAVFYYGWKKKLPVKAKAANNWGWIGFLIGLVIYFGINSV